MLPRHAAAAWAAGVGLLAVISVLLLLSRRRKRPDRAYREGYALEYGRYQAINAYSVRSPAPAFIDLTAGTAAAGRTGAGRHSR